jgi:hypothetical protein
MPLLPKGSFEVVDNLVADQPWYVAVRALFGTLSAYAEQFGSTKSAPVGA